MKHRKENNLIKYLIIPVLIAAFALIVLLISLSSKIKVDIMPQDFIAINKKLQLVSSHESGFYQDSFDLSFSCNFQGNYQILYTITSSGTMTDILNEKKASTGEVYKYFGGKLPSYYTIEGGQGTAKTHIYENPIEISGDHFFQYNPNKLTIVIAAIFDGNKRLTDYHYFTFIINENFDNKLPNYFVSLIVDEENLYGDEEGILIKGNMYTNELINNPSRQVDDWFPRNYNQRGKEWERPARIQIFDKNGQLVIDQGVGVRVAGGMSRHNPLKSLRVVTREKYDQENLRLDYELFDNIYDYYGNKILDFDRVILRNSANDFGQTMFKDVFGHKLGGAIGLDYQEGTACIVYLNGKYYSLMNIRESIDSDYVEAHYGIDKKQVSMISIGSGTGHAFFYKVTDGPDIGLKYYRRAMNQIISTDYSNKDISEIDQIIDVDNFIEYMAYNMFIANSDWPHNNVLAWSYMGTPNSRVYGMDGKWRFILKDLDIHTAFTNSGFNSYGHVLRSQLANSYDPSIGQVFKSCIKNKEFASRFADYMTELCTSLITYELVDGLLNDLQEEREEAMPLFWYHFWGNKKEWDRIANDYRDFIEKRAEFMIRNLSRYI